MAIEIVDFPMKHGDFPDSHVNVYQAGYPKLAGWFISDPNLKWMRTGGSPISGNVYISIYPNYIPIVPIISILLIPWVETVQPSPDPI